MLKNDMEFNRTQQQANVLFRGGCRTNSYKSTATGQCKECCCSSIEHANDGMRKRNPSLNILYFL